MLPQFLYCQNDAELPGAGLVLYTRPPYYLFKVLKFNQQDAEYFITDTNRVYLQVPGYRVYLQHYEQLIKPIDHIFNTVGYKEELQIALVAAVSFYKSEKIIPNAYQFKRYKTE